MPAGSAPISFVAWCGFTATEDQETMLEAPTTESATTTSAWDWPPGGAPGGQRPVEDVVAEVGRLDGVREMIAVRAVCRGGGDPHAGGAPRQAHAGWPLASRVRRLRCAPRTWC